MRQNKTSRRIALSSAIERTLVGLLLLATSVCAAATTTVKFATPPWPGATVKTQVAVAILEAIGYHATSGNAAYAMLGGSRGFDVNSATGSWGVNASSIGNGFKDANLAVWMPMQKGLIDPLVQSGKIKLVVANVPQAQYDLVVPDYVWQAGVHCICDLHKHGGRFEHKIYGIEAGNHGNQIVKDAIKYNTYGLEHWRLVASNVNAMLDTAQKLIKQHKWVVFLGWKPHWMNKKLNIRYLRDPQNLWHIKQTQVYSALNAKFMQKNPNVVRFLKQMAVGSALQSQWVYDYGYKGVAADKVAKAWITNNPDKVGQWLQGVKTADGKQAAIDAVRAKFKP